MAVVLPAGVRSLLASPAVRRILEEELGAFGALTRKRAAPYSQRIGSLAMPDERTFEATVHGERDYQTLWFWDGIGWEHECTCPVGYLCKHSYALANVVLQAHKTGADIQPAAGPSTPTSPAEVEVQRRALAQLRDTPGSWSRRHILQQLLVAAGLGHIDPFSDAFTPALDENDPEMVAWRLAATIAELAGEARVPVVLQPYLSGGAMSGVLAERLRDAALGELWNWAHLRTLGGAKQLRFAVHLQMLPKPSFAVTALLSSARLRDEPRTAQQLMQLRDEAARDAGVLSEDEFRALDYFLRRADVYAFGSRCDISPEYLVRLARLGARRGLLRWADDIPDDIAERTGIAPGSPVQVDPAPVRIQPEIFGEGERTMMSLFAVWPDERRRRLERCLFVRPGVDGGVDGALLSDGVLWQVVEFPPAKVLHNFEHAGKVEIVPELRAQVLPQLAASFANIEATVSLHTRRLPVEPVVLLELGRDDWLHVRLFAREHGSTWTPATPSSPTTRVYEAEPDGRWTPLDAGAIVDSDEVAADASGDATAEARETAAAEAVGDDFAADELWLEQPDTEALAPVVTWIDGIGARPARSLPPRRQPAHANAAMGLWLRVDADSIEHLFDQWGTRPRAVYLGNRRLRRVMQGTEVVRPRVKVHTSGTDWFSVSASWEAEGLALSDADVAKLRGAKSAFVRLSSGWARREAIEAHDAAAEVLADLGVEVDAGEQRVSLWHLAGASAASLEALEAMGADPTTTEAVRILRRRVAEFTGVPEKPLPATVKAELRPYQQRGFDFLGYAADLGIGAILADDMGLGKTVQALAWVAWLKETARGSGPCLVVCPASVVHNWLREAELFTPALDVLVLGSGAGRSVERERWAEADIIVTNYALLRRDRDFWRERHLRAVILDEAQNIKNPDAAVAQVARSLDADFRIALTGTPLENRALDLWSIVEFVNPGYLGRRSDFAARFDRSDLPPYQRQLLAAKLRPILLRRLKREVARELPERIEERIDCEMSPAQRKLYLAELRRSRALVAQLAADADGLRRHKIQVLAALTRLRQICCHPALAGGPENSASGKFDALFDLLESLRDEGHKVLVFSQFVQCLQRIGKEMKRRDLPYHLLTGQSRQREAIVRGFQEDPDPNPFLISLKAGGAGLNLTAASYVVLFDPWWNPAVEAQAIDRTHRIGQDKTVIAYRLVAAGTIEEKIFDLQQRKAALARDVLGEDGFAKALSREDLTYLFADE